MKFNHIAIVALFIIGGCGERLSITASESLQNPGNMRSVMVIIDNALNSTDRRVLFEVNEIIGNKKYLHGEQRKIYGDLLWYVRARFRLGGLESKVALFMRKKGIENIVDQSSALARYYIKSLINKHGHIVLKLKEADLIEGGISLDETISDRLNPMDELLESENIQVK